MIHYHGGPITPYKVAELVWSGRHGFASFWYPDQIGVVAECCQTFGLDNGAFSAWTQGVVPDWNEYRRWVQEWGAHPGCDFAVIPDVIDGDEAANDDLVRWWHSERMPCLGVPVWHMHESVERLKRLCAEYPRVALGSSGQWPEPQCAGWWDRIDEAFAAICDDKGSPPCKLHGLRMMHNTITSKLPLSSVDSTNVAQNHWRERHRFALAEEVAVIKMIKRIEEHAIAPYWTAGGPGKENLILVG